jgi:hypothetical protein
VSVQLQARVEVQFRVGDTVGITKVEQNYLERMTRVRFVIGCINHDNGDGSYIVSFKDPRSPYYFNSVLVHTNEMVRVLPREYYINTLKIGEDRYANT